jgi:hypothetical protein
MTDMSPAPRSTCLRRQAYIHTLTIKERVLHREKPKCLRGQIRESFSVGKISEGVSGSSCEVAVSKESTIFGDFFEDAQQGIKPFLGSLLISLVCCCLCQKLSLVSDFI